jgi:uncharacterized protein YbcC (UPF0753/DUF2309 family)
MNTTLAKMLNGEKEPEYLSLDIHGLVEAASKVIAPLDPINTFAARNPWVGMENQSFERTARKLKDACGVEIIPDHSLIKSAWSRGEIQQDFLENELNHWLHSQNLELPLDVAKGFCMAALMKGGPDPKQLGTSEVKALARKLNNMKNIIPKKQTVQTYSQRMKIVQKLNRQVIKWCKLFLDESQAVWSMPHREKGFYQAWRDLVPYDPDLEKKIRTQLKDLPKESDLALKSALLGLEIPYSDIQEYLEAHLLSLPGWAGMMLWRSQQAINGNSLLIDYLAVRLSMEQILIKPYLPMLNERDDKVLIEPLIIMWSHYGNFSVEKWSELSNTEQKARLTLAYRFDKILRNHLWLKAWEKTYEEELMKKMINHQLTWEKGNKKSAMAQFIFCIDVRSEPFRRYLENAGPFETLGTAGFFGLPIETCEIGGKHKHDSLPVMFKPQFRINEFLPKKEYKQYQQRQQTTNSLGVTFQKLKYNLVSSMVLPEISGPLLILQTLARSFVPRNTGLAVRKIREAWLRKPSTELTLDHTKTSDVELPVGFTDKEKVHFVRQALKMMGLTDHFSPLVVFCGHGSHSTNNPYKSALDCGACGGASSGFNARVLAELCNLPNVRHSLALEGIMIPENTVFAAAEHITTLDKLSWIYIPELSNEAKEAFNQIQTVLPKVREDANAERIMQLPNSGCYDKNPKFAAERLAEDWSEVRPEWGLARNAAFIIGERKLTRESNLEGRVFLHNYDWTKDKNGTLLSNIINGPVTVAQWINLQYYASTVAPHYYGSGNKATQTLTAGIGVMQGNASDLLPGLPWQSVMKSDQEVYHAPLRLLVVIQAPKEHVNRLLDTEPSFHQKIKNGWIRLASIGPEGNWESWS